MTDAIRDAREHLKAGMEALRSTGVAIPIELHLAAHALSHATASVGEGVQDRGAAPSRQVSGDADD